MNDERKINRLERELEVKQRIINENEKIVYQQAADLARITAERDVLQKRLDYIKANQTDRIAVRFALIASDEEITEKEIDAE